MLYSIYTHNPMINSIRKFMRAADKKLAMNWGLNYCIAYECICDQNQDGVKMPFRS